MTMPIFVLVGPIGSGKTTAAEAIGQRFGLSVLNIGDLLASRLENTPLERTRIGPDFIERFGLDAYRDLVFDAVKPGVVADGLRSPGLVGALRSRSAGRAGERVLVIYCEPSEAPQVPNPYHHWVTKLPSAAERTLPWFADPSGPALKAAAAVKAAEALVGVSATQQRHAADSAKRRC